MLPSLMGIDGFLPTWYSGCALWLDPSWGVFTDTAATTPANIGDAVAAWRCRATGVMFTQETLANRPTLQAANGRPWVVATAAGRTLSGTPAISAPFSFAMALRTDLIDATSRTFFGGAGAAIYQNSTTGIINQFFGNALATGVAPVSGVPFSLRGVGANGAASSIARNLASLVVGNAGTTLGGPTFTLFNATSGGVAVQGACGGLVLYSRVCSDAELLRAERFLRTQAGVGL